MTAQVLLQPKRARPFYGRHPWVYPGAISAIEGEPADGDVVELVAHGGHFVARGLYNSRSKIRVRLFTWDAETPLDRAFFREQLASAIRLRHDLGLMSERSGCRLVNSEGDGLSGCTVDRYGKWLVLQFTSLALAQRCELFVELLTELLQPEGIYLRTERGIGQLEGLELHDGPLTGSAPAEPLEIDEDGLTFLVDLAEGQKTGYYLDQRDNRRAVAPLSKGRRVLDAFCYSGGFGLHGARAGATEVVGVDQSEPALALARRNAERNRLTQLSFVRADVFDHLDTLISQGQRFGLIVLDPPKFARDRKAIDEALRSYRRLQLLALRLLDAEGYLVTCCCSGLITPDMLEDVLARVAGDAGREVQIIERRGPAADHPVLVSCLESHYLKCSIARVR
jgi:23S rRNA (cytosine1962-C5)-methyltransferase